MDIFDVEGLCASVKRASFRFTKATTEQKNAVLAKIMEKESRSAFATTSQMYSTPLQSCKSA